MMRSILAAALFGLIGSAARAEVPGYVDTARVRLVATEPTRMDADFRSDQADRSQAIQKAFGEAQAAKPAASGAAWDTARKVQRENNDVLKKHAEEVDAAFLKRLGEILVKLRVDKHVSITAGPGVILVPGVDLTGEAIRRWDAADAKGMADELAKAKAENERLRAAAAKPESPKK